MIRKGVSAWMFFWYRHTPVVPDKVPLNGCECMLLWDNQQCMKLKLFIKQCKQLSCSYKSVLVKGQWCHAAGQVIERLNSQWPCCICVLPTIIYLPYYISGWTCTAFSVAGPMAWDSLPDSIGDPTNSTDCFSRLLKTYLLRDTSALSTWGSWR